MSARAWKIIVAKINLPISAVYEQVSAYLEDDTPLRLAHDVLTGLEHAQGHTVQKYNQHAHMLEPGDHESRKENLHNVSLQVILQVSLQNK